MIKFLARFNSIFYMLVGLSLASCASYRQNIMFRVPDGKGLDAKITSAEKNYLIQKNDQLELKVHTNKGEQLVDPQAVLSKDLPTPAANPPVYLVATDGIVKFPMLDPIKMEGLTIREGEALLEEAYKKFYQDPFVTLKYANKRVVVLGAPGGQVIPLTNENMRLTEVLALAKGVGNDAKAQNIRVLRGDQVMLADFSTFEGYQKYNYIIEPNDIVYVEPIRRPFVEGVRDYYPVVSVMASFATLIVVIIGL